jgi:hypothetical protein
MYSKSTFFISPEDGDSMFLRNVGVYIRVYTCLHTPDQQNRHLHSREPNISHARHDITYTYDKENPKMQYVICGEDFANSNLKTSVFRRHLEISHLTQADKPLIYKQKGNK